MLDFVVFDIETTGLYANGNDRIIEIATVVLDNDLDVVERWETLICPERDVGPSHIHGISAADVANAPTFHDLAGDIWHRFEGAIPVSHNLMFDSRFLLAEFARNGFIVDDFEGVCTLELMRSIDTGTRHTLIDCCRFFKLELDAPHSAGDDAFACANLWLRLIREFEISDFPAPLVHAELRRKPPTPLGITRRTAQRRKQHSFIGALMEKLPGPATNLVVASGAIDSYLLMLEQSIEDRAVDELEAVQLQELATSLGLNSSQIAESHRAFLGNLASIAMADGELSPAERCDYLRVAQLVGISDESALELLDAINADPAISLREDLSGKSVCFTGDSQCCLNGQRIDKKRAEELVVGAGLKAAKSVTKKLDILVVADPDTMSGKAKKARDYGTRIVAERAFWPKVGVFVD